MSEQNKSNERVVEIIEEFGLVVVTTQKENHKYINYRFAKMSDWSDDVVGDEDLDNVLCYTESSIAHNVWITNKENVPDIVLTILKDNNWDVRNGETSWYSWNGRPEFSEPKIEIE